ncbi:MAG TPA: selenium-binding protein SBP56-related protein [Methylomirabilota bacterium]|nr:selenium-binding protein SBP56-related protein [Methylomirabilota bacterium]
MSYSITVSRRPESGPADAAARGRSVPRLPRAALRLAALAVAILAAGAAAADETCQSPYMAKITSQEDFLYVWTLGEEGVGDGSDKLVTVDVRPGSETYGEVIHTLSVGGRHEAHHGGLTDDRRYLWAGGLDTSRIFIFDLHSDPAKPRLAKTITDFVAATGGVVGPHTFYALPGRMLISGLSNDKDHGPRTALVEYSNDGKFIASHWIPTADDPRGAEIEEVADGMGYDVRALPRRNVMITSSFTGWSNYMMDFGALLEDAEAMKRFGQTVVIWNLHTRKPEQVLHVPGAPLEVRVAWGPKHDYAFTTTALTSKIWLIHETAPGTWQATAVADIGDPEKVPLPVAFSLSADDNWMWVDTFMDGSVRLFDVSDPFEPKQVYQKKIGSQLNMVSQSWDGERLYFTSSLLSNWDKKGADDEQFLKAYTWDGSELKPSFTIDFYEEGLGRAHLMRFGSTELYGASEPKVASVR